MQTKILISLVFLSIVIVACGDSYSPCNPSEVSEVKYGMTTEEVRKVFGYPDRVFTLGATTTYFIYDCGQYELWVGFENGVVERLSCSFIYGETSISCPLIEKTSKIEYGMTMEEVRKILGNPDVFPFHEMTYFIYDCGPYKLFIGFENGVVTRLECSLKEKS